MKKWECQTDKTHVFDQRSKNGFCPICGGYEGFLMLKEIDGDQSVGPGPEDPPDRVKIPPPPEIGLCVMLMDASTSMFEPAFKKLIDPDQLEEPVSLMRLVANSAASGIFDLSRLQNNPNAYIAAFKFTDHVEFMFLNTVANIIKEHNADIEDFADYLYEELEKMKGGYTNINKALEEAYDFVDRFLTKQMPDFPIDDYVPMRQRILKHDMASVSIANVRVLIYTDGEQYGSDGDKTLKPNPFKVRPSTELNHDIVIGAFFGDKNDPGCEDLKTILSKCPMDDELQFFLFDKPAEVGRLKYLFRMASGASGFCPICLQRRMR